MTPGGELAVDLRAVTVREGSRPLLDMVTLPIGPGQGWAVIGPNTGGTSALLRVVAGLRRPDSGQVWIGGWNALRHPDQVRRLIGYVPNEPGLAERLTPAEHLALVAAQRGISRTDRKVATESMIELVDLADVSQVYASKLSRGQRRRLALALALVHDPPIILLDEPFDGLNDVGRGEVISVLIELRSMGKTLLIACQSPSEVADICESVAHLDEGRLSNVSAGGLAALGWVEVLGDVGSTLRLLREHPSVSDIHYEGTFVTFRGPLPADDRARFVAWLLSNGVMLSGFGTTTTPAGADRS